MVEFIKRHYAFLYYKQYVLKKGIKPIDIKMAITMYFCIYLFCLLSLGIGLSYIFHLSVPSLLEVKIVGGILFTIVSIFVHFILRKVDHQQYQFNYKRDNIFYTAYEILGFVFLLVVVLGLKWFINGNVK